MKYEESVIYVDGVGFDVLKCDGNGQCKCKGCGVFHWTSWFYKLRSDGNVYCYDCIKGKLKKRLKPHKRKK